MVSYRAEESKGDRYLVSVPAMPVAAGTPAPPRSGLHVPNLDRQIHALALRRCASIRSQRRRLNSKYCQKASGNDSQRTSSSRLWQARDEGEAVAGTHPTLRTAPK